MTENEIRLFPIYRRTINPRRRYIAATRIKSMRFCGEHYEKPYNTPAVKKRERDSLCWELSCAQDGGYESRQETSQSRANANLQLI